MAWNVREYVVRIGEELDVYPQHDYEPGAHAGLLLVRLAKPGRDSLFERVSTLFSTEPVEEWRGCLVVATDRKIRIRRPRDTAR